MEDLKERQGVKEFPINVSKTELAAALNISMTTLQNMLNKQYYNEIIQLGYSIECKNVNRHVLWFLHQKVVLLPEDFSK